MPGATERRSCIPRPEAPHYGQVLPPQVKVKPVEVTGQHYSFLQGIPGPGTEPSDQVETRKPSLGVDTPLLVEGMHIHIHVYQLSLGSPSPDLNHIGVQMWAEPRLPRYGQGCFWVGPGLPFNRTGGQMQCTPTPNPTS